MHIFGHSFCQIVQSSRVFVLCICTIKRPGGHHLQRDQTITTIKQIHLLLSQQKLPRTRWPIFGVGQFIKVGATGQKSGPRAVNSPGTRRIFLFLANLMNWPSPEMLRVHPYILVDPWPWPFTPKFYDALLPLLDNNKSSPLFSAEDKEPFVATSQRKYRSAFRNITSRKEYIGIIQ